MKKLIYLLPILFIFFQAIPGICEHRAPSEKSLIKKSKKLNTKILTREDFYKVIERGEIRFKLPGFSTHFFSAKELKGLLIAGVHQENDKADVYFFCKHPRNPALVLDGVLHVIRFNSGLWYVPEVQCFLEY